MYKVRSKWDSHSLYRRGSTSERIIDGGGGGTGSWSRSEDNRIGGIVTLIQ